MNWARRRRTDHHIRTICNIISLHCNRMPFTSYPLFYYERVKLVSILAGRAFCPKFILVRVCGFFYCANVANQIHFMNTCCLRQSLSIFPPPLPSFTLYASPLSVFPSSPTVKCEEELFIDHFKSVPYLKLGSTHNCS